MELADILVQTALNVSVLSPCANQTCYPPDLMPTLTLAPFLYLPENLLGISLISLTLYSSLLL